MNDERVIANITLPTVNIVTNITEIANHVSSDVVIGPTIQMDISIPEVSMRSDFVAASHTVKANFTNGVPGKKGDQGVPGGTNPAYFKQHVSLEAAMAYFAQYPEQYTENIIFIVNPDLIYTQLSEDQVMTDDTRLGE